MQRWSSLLLVVVLCKAVGDFAGEGMVQALVEGTNSLLVAFVGGKAVAVRLLLLLLWKWGGALLRLWPLAAHMVMLAAISGRLPLWNPVSKREQVVTCVAQPCLLPAVAFLP